MDSDEDQQALAWQWIIRNKAFDNVRVQRGESWVDAACRTLDELIDQKEQAEESLSEFLESQPKVVWRERALEAERYLVEARRERDAAVARAEQAENARDTAATRAEQLDKKLAKLMSDYQDVEDERDEWKARADKWHRAWQKSAPNRTVTRDDIDRALINVISNAMNYPDPVQILGKDTGPLRKKCVDAVCALFGIETEPADPVEQKAVELFEATDESIWTWATAPVQTQDMYRRIAEHVLWQEDRHVDQ